MSGASGGGEIQALVNYYARAGYARHLQTMCGEVLRKRSGDPTLQFWRAFGMIMEGSYSEAIMQLEGLFGCATTSPIERPPRCRGHTLARAYETPPSSPPSHSRFGPTAFRFSSFPSHGTLLAPALLLLLRSSSSSSRSRRYQEPRDRAGVSGGVHPRAQAGQGSISQILLAMS